jgi:hypothetical protein
MIQRIEICCDAMAVRLLDDRESKSSNIAYRDTERLYVIYTYPGFSNRRITSDKISFCPWCGKSLPNDLCREYNFQIENLNIKTAEHGLIDRRRLPKEYRSDLWWKIRGL